tara:strand:- start:561 stop:962 length:402 start_codon:yes stop_codon:yes gene_type:complete
MSYMNQNRSKSYDAHGRVISIGETELKGQKQFPVRKFRLQTDGGKYSNLLEFEVTGDRCAEIDRLEVGSSVLVHFNVRGREWRDKVFMSLNAWKVENTEHPEDRDERLQRDAYSRASDYAHAGLAVDDSDIPF